jgi:hypothetical protein
MQAPSEQGAAPTDSFALAHSAIQTKRSRSALLPVLVGVGSAATIGIVVYLVVGNGGSGAQRVPAASAMDPDEATPVAVEPDSPIEPVESAAGESEAEPRVEPKPEPDAEGAPDPRSPPVAQLRAQPRQPKPAATPSANLDQVDKPTDAWDPNSFGGRR